MRKWMIKAVQGTSVPPRQEGLPEWLENVLDPTRLLLEYRVRMMEDSIPKVTSTDLTVEEAEYPANEIISAISDIILSGNMPLLKEVFILLHRRGLTFPAIWLPDLLDAPARERKYFSNLVYLGPSWISKWIEHMENHKRLPDKAVSRWKRLLLMPDPEHGTLHPDELLFLIQHELFNQRFPSDSLLKRAWKRMNTDQKVHLILLLPDNSKTESFLMAQRKTRSATLRHLITLKLMKIKGDFYTIVKESAASIPVKLLIKPETWPDVIIKNLGQRLDLTEKEDVQTMVFLLRPEDLTGLNVNDLSDLLKTLPVTTKNALFTSAVLHENIELVQSLAMIDRSVVSDMSEPEFQLISTQSFNLLLEKCLYGKWLGHQGITELMLLKESYFPGSISMKLVKWLRYEIIDKKPFLAEDILDALSYRADPKIYPELLAMNEQSIYYPANVVKPLKNCIKSMQQRLAFRNALRKVL